MAFCSVWIVCSVCGSGSAHKRAEHLFPSARGHKLGQRVLLVPVVGSHYPITVGRSNRGPRPETARARTRPPISPSPLLPLAPLALHLGGDTTRGIRRAGPSERADVIPGTASVWAHSRWQPVLCLRYANRLPSPLPMPVCPSAHLPSHQRLPNGREQNNNTTRTTTTSVAWTCASRTERGKTRTEITPNAMQQ